jgi:hypothetical protein
MAYDAVYNMYTDEDSSTFNEYHLITFEAVQDGDEEIEITEGTRYTKTPGFEWNQVEDGEGWSIGLIQSTGNEDFSINITGEEVEQLKDEGGEIWFEKVFQWCLPRFDDNDDVILSEFQAARMRNYMGKRVVLMLDPFKNKGHCGVMDSAYMIGTMCQVGREKLKMNMVGTCQGSVIPRDKEFFWKH